LLLAKERRGVGADVDGGEGDLPPPVPELRLPETLHKTCKSSKTATLMEKVSHSGKWTDIMNILIYPSFKTKFLTN